MSHDFAGVLLAIHIAPEASAPMVELDAARLVEGVGIEGDRYATARGTYSHKPAPDRQVTLIEMETLDLVGREFRVGDTVLLGGRLNVPCQYLEDLLGKKVFKPLINRSGLNCLIVKGGTIRPGDAIRPA